MGNTDKKESKKFRRKIRIRLTDPNIPDSYICEVFDSSLENEDEEFSKSNDTLQKGKHDPSKPKNYFELLMSKSCKKNDVPKTTEENVGCKSENDEEDDSDEAFQNRKQKCPSKNKSSLKQSTYTSRKKVKYKFDSSENRSFVQIERKNKSENIIVKQENEDVKDLKQNESHDVITIFDSPKIDLSRKKTLSILNYFSKTEVSQNNSLKCHKLEVSPTVELNTCQSENSLQHAIKNDSDNPHRNGTKQMLLNSINKENVKLAPLFCRKGNRILDSARQKARHEFLHKGSPSGIKKSEAKSAENIFYFPIITHVQQRNESMCWSLRHICLPLQKVCNSECVLNEKKKFSLQIKQSAVVNKAVSGDIINFSKDLFCKIKCKYLKLDLGSIVDGLKDKRDRFSTQEGKVEKSKINSSKALNVDLGCEELNALWTEKYKPKSCEILGNVDAVRKLKRWLQSWKTFNDELKVLVDHSTSSRNKQDSSDDDGNDFLDFANENYGLKTPGNVCIISGPNGCGKTALVYALANELEFNVLELNASSKRTGKKVLSDLQEATQSHKVHGVNLPQNIAVKGVSKNSVKKQKKNKKKCEPVKIDHTNDCKISLILIEDADIVYDDHDEGFYSAIASLVHTSKRPLIFLTNEPNCPYLENLKTDQCLILEMETPNFYKSCAVLDVVSSLEGVHFEKELLESLLRENNFDLRKSLLELQFWIRSGRNIKNVERVFDLGHLWWGLSKFLFNQDMMHIVKTKGVKRKRTKHLFDSSDDEVGSVAKKFKSDPGVMKGFYSGKGLPTKITESSIESYFGVLDLASTLDGFCVSGSQEPIPGYECRPKDSLALCENMEEVSWGRKLSEELSDAMISLSAGIFSGRFKEEKTGERNLNFVSPCWEEIRWRDSQVKASEELSMLVSLQKRGEKRSLHLDYLPILRSMCRIERHRSESNPKRKNRFYHYLNNLGPELTEENLEINCEILDH